MSNVTVVPWGLHPLSGWVTDELKRRTKEYGQNPTPDASKPYSGPRTAWARVFSNGISNHPAAKGKDGFVLGGTYGFAESYGFNTEKTITIGVDAKGEPHKIPFDRATTSKGKDQADFPHRPPPSLTSVSCELNGSNSSFPNLCRKITFNWRCFSLAQLNYMMPYFLNPRITCLVEWGWNNYNRAALADLSDLDWINEMFVDPSYTLEYIKQSNGNYDAGLGFITDYGFKMSENGGYDCFTTIINANRLIEGEQIANKVVTVKQEQSQLPVKSFFEFAKKNLTSIDSDTQEYKNIRKALNLVEKIQDADENVIDTIDNIEDRVFRIKDDKISKNKKGFWLRMDLVQDIINAFFQITMENPKVAIIRNFDIMQTRMSANPFVKSTGKDGNVLVPNKYAPRFVYETEKTAGAKKPTQEGVYDLLFKEKIDSLKKEYNFDTSFDDLQKVINKNGQSFPVYDNLTINDEDGKTAQILKSGYWGNLKDLFINAEYFKSLVEKNDSVLKLIEQLLQGINESLCQICQLKLQPAEYGNSKYSVYDENLAGISTKNDAKLLPKITLGAIDSAFLKNVSFDVKLSAEMMNQLVMQSANPEQDPNGSTSTSNTKATPITSRYSAGDRLYRKGEIKTIITSESSAVVETPEQQKKRVTQEQTVKNKEIEKKKTARSESNDNFFIYYEPNPNDPKNPIRYYLYEKDKDFLNNLLTLPNKKSSYLNNAIMPGTTLTLELLGISGINYLSQFVIDHAPDAYNYENAVWQISDIKQTIEDKMWTTTVTAQVRPLTVL
jgi:hypothetical protein